MTLEYTLTFGGVPFFEDDPQAGAGLAQRGNVRNPLARASRAYLKVKHEPMWSLVERYLPTELLNDFEPAGGFLGKSLSNLARRPGMQTPGPNVRVGDWFYPNTASRWSVFRGLATSKALTAMAAASLQMSAPATFEMQCSPISPDNPEDNDPAYTLSTQMYMLPPRPVGETAGDVDGLYLITLVDERYFFQGTPVNLSVTVNTQWTDLIAQLATAGGIVIHPPAVLPTYGQPEPDSQLWCRMEDVASLLDAVAYNLGTVVVRNLDGTYDLLSPAVSLARVNSNRGAASSVVRLAGGNLFEGPGTALPAGDLTLSRNPALPATVNVSFPCYVAGDDPVPHFVKTRYLPQRPSCLMEDSPPEMYTVTVPLAQCGLSAPPFNLPNTLVGVSQQSFRSTAKAVYNTEAGVAGAPTNVTQLNALAVQVATDYCTQQAGAALDEVYPGTFAWSPEGFHDLIWTYSTRSRTAQLRTMRGPWNGGPEEFQHATPGLATTAPRGVGGPSVAQTWRDQFGGGPAPTTPATTNLAVQLGATGASVTITAADYLPTQNRWKGEVDSEIILFEGTSGGTSVTVAARGQDGTAPASHLAGAVVTQITPHTSFGVNLVTIEKGQYAYPAELTSGGVQGVQLIPQTQTVEVLDGTGKRINNVQHYSGAVGLYNTAGSSGNLFTQQELVWVTERNGRALSSGNFYAGQFAGHSASGPVAPVYTASSAQNVTNNISNDTFTWTNVVVTFNNDILTFNSLTILNFAGPTFNFTANTTWNFSANVTINLVGFATDLWVFNLPLEVCDWMAWCYKTMTWGAGVQSQDNWTGPSDITQRAINWRLVTASSGTFDLTGMVPGLPQQIIGLLNCNACGGDVIFLQHENAFSAAANRFSCPACIDFAIPPKAGVIVWYDPVVSRWKVYSELGGGGAAGGGAAVTAASTLFAKEVILGADVTLNHDGTHVDVFQNVLDLNLPGAGTYLVWGTVQGASSATTDSSTFAIDNWITVKLRDTTNNADIPNTRQTGAFYQHFTGGTGVQETINVQKLITVAGAVTISLQAHMNPSSNVDGTALVMANNGNPGGGWTKLCCLQVS